MKLLLHYISDPESQDEKLDESIIARIETGENW